MLHQEIIKLKLYSYFQHSIKIFLQYEFAIVYQESVPALFQFSFF